jgi:hypothetical protein
MNDYEVRELYEQVQCLEVQVQRLVEALIGDDDCCSKEEVKEEAPAKAEDETAADEEE